VTDHDHPRAAVARLGRAQRALVTGHLRPDGDSLGSQLALAELAHALGVSTTVVNHDTAPSSLSQLPGIETVVVSDDLPADFPNAFDLVVAIECPDRDRAGFSGLDRLPILNIDHHPANDLYGEVNYIDVGAPAVGEMIWRMFAEAGVEASATAATNAYVALSTDTGDFRYSNATGRAFRAAAEMVDAGASPTTVAHWIHGRRPAAAVKLLGEALSTLRFEAGGRVAVVELDEAAFRRSGAGPEDTEDVINHPRAIDGVRAVAFLKQWEPGVVRISLRSTGDVNVRRVAEEFGGGGHANAAGCTIESDLADARERIVAALGRAVEPAS
jgi:phosphoesterase RecJ-like protein